MNKRSKKLYCVVAVLLVGMSAVLPSFSQAFLQGIQAEEDEELIELNLEENRELEINNRADFIVKDESGANVMNSSQSVTSEGELTLALADEDVSEIVITGVISVSNTIYINRQVAMRGENVSSRIELTNQGEVVILESGTLVAGGINDVASRDLTIGTTNKNQGTAMTIDGGELLIREAAHQNVVTVLSFSGGGTPNSPITMIEVKNGGVLNNTGCLRIENIHPDSIGIRLNTGMFLDYPSGFLSGFVKSGYAIVSETGLNGHNFIHQNTSTVVYSKIETPMYTNSKEATITVNGSSNRLVFWGRNTVTNAGAFDEPDFAIEDFQFLVNQVGNSRPTIQSISNPEYSFLFSTNILGNFRAMRSGHSGSAGVPEIKLPESIEVTPTISRVLVGENKQLIETLTPDPSQLDNASVFWSSSDSSVVRVDDMGVITGVRSGLASISAETINGLSATVEVNVEAFTYEFSGTDGNSTAVITGYHGTDSDIEIPRTTVNHEDGWTSTSTVVGIGNRALSDKGLTNVLIPDNITEIGESAFFRNALTNLTIPDTVTSLGQQAFLENNLTNLHIGSGLSRLENQVFGLNNLSSITIPNTVQQIGTLAFHSNSLTEVTIPETVTHLGLRAFENNALEKVTFIGEISGLGAQVFGQNPLKEIHVEESSLAHYQREFSPNIIRGVTERTLLRVEESRYSDDTQRENNLIVGDELTFNVLSKNRYQLANLESYAWEEFIPVIQWFKDAQVLTEETKQKFSIAEVEESDSGSYYAIVDGSKLHNLSVEVYPVIQPDIPAINPEEGLLELEHTNPVIEGLSLRYVSDLHFGATTFSSSNQTLYANKTDEIPKVTVQDMRSTSQRNGWELQVRQNRLFMDGAELIFNPFVHEINQDTLNIKAHDGALTVNSELQRFAGTTTTENPSGIATMGMGSADGSGVYLQIPGGVGVGSYETTLIWNLVALPSKASEHIVEK